MINLPSSSLIYSSYLARSVFTFGWLICLTVSGNTESSLSMFWSTFFSASRTLSRWSMEPLVSTDTFAAGKNSSRSARESSIIPAKSGCSVGSPFPAYVITSGALPCSFISESFFFSASPTSRRDGSFSFESGLSGVQPHSQYIQLYEHTLRVTGRRFIPRETPSRRLCTGPNTMLSKRKVGITQMIDQGYKFTIIYVSGCPEVKAGGMSVSAPGSQEADAYSAGQTVPPEAGPDACRVLLIRGCHHT